MKRIVAIATAVVVLTLILGLYCYEFIPKRIVAGIISENCELVENIALKAESFTYHELAKETALAGEQIEKLKSKTNIISNPNLREKTLRYLTFSCRLLEEHKKLWELFAKVQSVERHIWITYKDCWDQLKLLDKYWTKAKATERVLFRSLGINYTKSSKAIFYRYKQTPIPERIRESIPRLYYYYEVF